MRVKILQGKQTGQVVDVCQSEGENLLTTGFGELAPPQTAPAADPAPVAEPEGGSLVDDDDDAIAPAVEEAIPARVRRRRAVPKPAPAARRRKRR